MNKLYEINEFPYGDGDNRSIIIYGDNLGAKDVFVYLDKECLGVFDSWKSLEAELKSKSKLKVSVMGCQFLLGYGFVPPPFTLYRNVIRLTIGDKLTIEKFKNKAFYEVDFPYLSNKSMNKQHSSNNELKKVLTDAVSVLDHEKRDIYIMQSSGKDSTALMLALKEAQIKNVNAITYNPNYRENEASDAKAIAKSFNYNHTIINADPLGEYDSFIRFCEKSPAINGDYALISYIYSLEKGKAEKGIVIDGMGNDIYMGHIPSKLESRLKQYSIIKLFPFLWDKFEVPPLGTKMSYALKSFMMYPTERVISGSHVSHSNVLDIFPHQTQYRSFFKSLYINYKRLSEVDLRAYVRGRLFDTACCMEKARLAAFNQDSEAIFPFTNGSIIQYYFNLREEDRYDYNKRTNKLALRRLLNAEFGEFKYLKEKGSFRYDIMSFIKANQNNILKEINTASSIIPSINRVFKYYWNRKENYVFNGPIHHLFVLSAWLNRRDSSVIGSFDQSLPEFELDISFKF
ncbi:asparagine synthase-related protein [Cohnella algarum]|uniref:asparagine synthase-related protein n=1 Tax=Cohnella algarum TaxID=2044859 RepID=UPI0019678757|nr:asparagine synthase-related protein [Cohnella algarum]MBN2980654.1 hypothetical protein [Cohnella algarum]